MEWKSVKLELPICNKKAFTYTEDEDDENWLESKNVLVVVNQIKFNNKYIALARIDEHNEWLRDDENDFREDEEVTHWLPLPELPII
jgi:hypothetical protein